MEVPNVPIITTSLTPELWTALCNAAVYSVRNKDTRAWRDSTMPEHVVGAGVDAAILEDTSGNRCVVENFAREINLDDVGLNGWDGSGSIAVDMWIYLWLIAQDPDLVKLATQWAFLASASYTAPSLPSGWTHKHLISAARAESNGSGGWRAASFRHSRGSYEFSGRRLIAAYGGARSRAAQSLAAAIPPLTYLDMADITLISKATSGTLEISAHTAGYGNPVHSAWSYAGKSGEDGGVIYCPGQSIQTAVTTTGGGTGSLYVRRFDWPEDVEP